MSAQVTIIGRMVADPEVTFTQNGKALARFRVVSSKRTKTEAGVWEDSDTTFWPCTAWGQLAENMADSLTKGDQVIVYGQAVMSSWETKEGEKRERIEVTAFSVGQNLRFAVTQHKNSGKTMAADAADMPF